MIPNYQITGQQVTPEEIVDIIPEQEKSDRQESRFRMRTISNASEFYKEITGNYTINGPQMFELVEAAIDSAFADSLFVGEQQSIFNFRE